MAAVVRVRGLPLLGSLIPISVDALGYFTRVLQRRGDRVGLDVGLRRVLLLCHPDDIETVLVRDRDSYGCSSELLKLRPIFGRGLLTSEGSDWRRQRSMIQPSFGRDALQSYGTTMLTSITEVLDEWAPHGRVDVHSQMMRYTRNVIWRGAVRRELAGCIASRRGRDDRLRRLAQRDTLSAVVASPAAAA